MRKVGVLFFAADPLSVEPNGRSPVLQLGDDVREVQERVKQSGHEDALDFDWRLAARTDDLPKALREKRPRVVHFSGHGDVEGVVLTAPDGYGAQQVDPAALTRIFEVFRHRVRLVVLSACYSQPQAKAIADVVGCAIGTSGKIMDVDAIQFNAAFYSAIACGESVQAAFDQASAEVELNQPRGTRPELHVGKGVNAARLFLVPRFRRLKQAAAAAGLVLASLVLIASWPPPSAGPVAVLRGVQLGDCGSFSTAPSVASPSEPAASASMPDAALGVTAALAEAKALCAAGNYDDAFPLFKEAADAGNAEALGFVGTAYLTGEGTRREPELGVKRLREGAQKRDVRSMITLAVLYHSGYAVDQSERWERHWLFTAATVTGDAEAMRRLAVFYREEGNDSALIWLPRAINAGSADASVDMGMMYDGGRLVRRDTAQALQLYQSAADAGSARGMFAMGAAYKHGFGVPQSYDSAIAYFRKAACKDSGDAMNALGAMYQEGLGVPKDRAEATRWFRLAQAAGSEVAEGNLRTLKTADRPRRWRGPVGKMLALLGISQSLPRMACTLPDRSAPQR